MKLTTLCPCAISSNRRPSRRPPLLRPWAPRLVHVGLWMPSPARRSRGFNPTPLVRSCALCACLASPPPTPIIPRPKRKSQQREPIWPGTSARLCLRRSNACACAARICDDGRGCVRGKRVDALGRRARTISIGFAALCVFCFLLAWLSRFRVAAELSKPPRRPIERA